MKSFSEIKRKIRYRHLIHSLLLFIFMGSLVVASAQQGPRQITGRVTDEQLKPVAGVSIKLIGTGEGDITDQEGRYRIHVRGDGDSLQFSHLNYASKTLVVGSTSILNVILTMGEQADELDQVVVVGYGTQKKVSVTGGVDVVKNKAFEGRAVVNVSQALQGTSPSLVIQQKSFEPGQGVNLNLRGVGTLGDNSPW